MQTDDCGVDHILPGEYSGALEPGSLEVPIIGVNVPWLHGAYGHDFGRNQAHPNWPVAYDSNKAHELLLMLRRFGVTKIRTWLFESGEGLIYDRRGFIMAVEETFIRNLKDFVEQVSDLGFKVYWTLLDANSVMRHRDRITRSLLMNAAAAESFCERALTEVAPLIAPVTWGVDLCNEPEAMISGSTGNGTSEGESWESLFPALTVLGSDVRRLMPDTFTSLGSGFQEYRNCKGTAYDFLKPTLGVLDYHTYMPDGQIAPLNVCSNGTNGSSPWILGEVGCSIPLNERSLREAWLKVQMQMARKLHRISGEGYRAAFLWYATSIDSNDASSLIFREEPGLALYQLEALVSEGRLRL